MNGIVRTALRAASIKNIFPSCSNIRAVNNQLSRALWTFGRHANATSFASIKVSKITDSTGCVCSRASHTKAEKELVEFLAEEIVAEKKAQKLKTIPTSLDDFKVSLDGAEVTLEKKLGNETITISFNINHSVESDDEPEINPNADQADVGEMKSKPSFNVDIVRGNQTLGFSCSFNNEPGASGSDDSYNDIFGIDEITLYEGEHSEKAYAVAGEIVDGYLYDLLMNYLEEKGISNEFAEKLIDLSTNYEHTAYVSLLEGLSKFTSGK